MTGHSQKFAEDGSSFTESQFRSLEVAERSMSCLSLLGSLFILSTFLYFPVFRKPINRLIFYATIGNLLTNVATLISVSGTLGGPESALCQFQGFLVQMFMSADSLWTFCMALNVYLTFFKGYDSSMLRDLEKWYFLFCYGTPLIPALIFLIIDKTTDIDKIYGPATLWCWIATEWDWMRIAFFYGPVWIVIAVTTTIYLVTGRDIFKQRAALRAFSRDRPQASSSLPPVPENPFNESRGVTKVTEIEVTSESIHPIRSDETSRIEGSEDEARSSFSSTRKLSNINTVPSGANCQSSNAWPYSPNASGSRPTQNSMATPNFSTTISVGCPKAGASGRGGGGGGGYSGSTPRRRNAPATNANTAAWGYAKVSMLMLMALIVVWVPSTINRVYSLIHPSNPSFALSFMAGLVLPLQGFWNAVIYILTSWRQTKDALRHIFPRIRHQVPSGRTNMQGDFTRQKESPCRHRTNANSDGSKDLSGTDSIALDPDFYDRHKFHERPPTDDIELSPASAKSVKGRV